MRIYCRSSLICLLVLAIPITACAAFRIKDADAVITLRGDRPCFSYPRDKEIQKTSYSFGGVSVSKAGSQGGVLWEIGISGQERKGIIEPDNHGTCIQYGIPHQGTTVKKAAEALLDDTPYFVVLRLSTSAGVTYNERRYLSYFCLSHNEKGDSIIESAGYDNTTSSWACLKQGKSPKRGFWQKLFGK